MSGVDELIAKDTCEGCRHCFGPLILMCGCLQSEFYEQPVHPLGYCDWFARTRARPEKG